MPNNKHLLSIESSILQNKILQLSNQLNILNQSNASKTQEDLIDQATKLLSTFFKQLSGPIFQPTQLIPNHKPDVLLYNSDLTNILYDLRIIFSELENLESILISHFNFKEKNVLK